MARRPAAATGQRIGWEHFSHDADIGVRGFGPSIEIAFEQAALALTAVVTEAEVVARVPVEIACEAPDVELLFVDWLNAVIYEMAVRRMLFGRFTVRIAEMRLRGEIWGEPVDRQRHAPACEPKGATLTALRVERGTDGIWSAGCVVDV
jgi:tRNA nucleotidyltransferase (CCA-adding enzyme)